MATQFSFTVSDNEISHLVALGGYKWTSSDLHSEDSGRTLDGTMHVYVIASKETLDISCVPMSEADASMLLQLLKGHAGTEQSFPVTYESPEAGGIRTANFYCSERNCEFMQACRGVKWWENIKFKLVEC